MLWSNKKEDETKPEMEGGNGNASLPADFMPQVPEGDVKLVKPDRSDDNVVSDAVPEAAVDGMMALYEASLKDVKEGQVVKGTIIEIRSSDVMVDVGYKAEGLIPLREFPDPKALNVGDIIEVLLESKEDEDGLIVISKEKADRLQGWERIISKYDEGALIQGKPTRKVKGGLMVNVGVEAFLPASLASLRGFCNLDELVGQEMEFKIVKINRPRKNIVLSRKDVLWHKREESRTQLLAELEKGKTVSGMVKNITDFGAFIDLGGLDGLLHIPDMSWGRISHPNEMLAIGDKVDVMVLDFNKESNKVSLGLKQKTENPWEAVADKYPVGSKVNGKVVNLMPYGAFVELEKGVEGLVHISEFSWTKRYNHPNELLAIGDVVETVVLDFDKDKQKISLGIKQLEADPWQNVEEMFPVETHVKGKVRNMTDYGAFIELAVGIDGLIHVSEMSWTKKVNHPREVLKKGQKVEALVLGVDSKNRKISLGLKQLMPDPWDKITDTYKPDSQWEGVITKLANFGMFVELEKDLEGLLHISELPEKTLPELEEKYKVGEKIKVTVLKVDASQRKIGLAVTK